MATTERERTRGSARSSTPENSATMGVILVVVALFVGLFLLVKGGGDAKETSSDKPVAGETSTGAANATTTTQPPSTIPIAQLEIIVANGSGVSGRAKRTAEYLKGLGYQTVTFVDGNSTAASQVYFVPEAQADAAGVAQRLGLPQERVQAMPQAVPLTKTQLGTGKVLVLVGPDFDPANPPAPSAPVTGAPAPGG